MSSNVLLDLDRLCKLLHSHSVIVGTCLEEVDIDQPYLGVGSSCEAGTNQNVANDVVTVSDINFIDTKWLFPSWKSCNLLYSHGC